MFWDVERNRRRVHSQRHITDKILFYDLFIRPLCGGTLFLQVTDYFLGNCLTSLWLFCEWKASQFKKSAEIQLSMGIDLKKN